MTAVFSQQQHHFFQTSTNRNTAARLMTHFALPALITFIQPAGIIIIFVKIIRILLPFARLLLTRVQPKWTGVSQ